MTAVANPNSESWRNYRTATPKQRLALDYVTQKGRWKGDTRKNRWCLVGGQGYGGKSHLLRTAAMEINMDLRDRGFPRSWGAIVCQTYEDLKHRHIARIEEEFEGIGRVRETARKGLHLEFFGEGLGGVYLRNMVSSGDAKANKNTRKGGEWEYVLPDELTEYTREQFDAMVYNLRSGRALPYSALLAGTNPDGQGHDFVKGIFHPEYRDFEDILFKKKLIDPRDILFVPMKKSDNPTYEANKEVIDARLGGNSDPAINAARDEGRWDIYSGGRFGAIWSNDVHLFLWPELMRELGVPLGVSPAEFVAGLERWGCEVYGSLDYGTALTSTSAYLLHIVDPWDNAWTFAELEMVGMALERQASMILNFEREWGVSPTIRICDPSLLGAAPEQREGLTRIERFRDEGVDFIPGLNDRVAGAQSVASALYWEKLVQFDGTMMIRRPRLRIHAGCRLLVAQIPVLPRDPLRPEDVAQMGGKWHWYDSLRYFIHTRFQGGYALEKEPEPWSRGWLRQLGEASRAKENDLWNDTDQDWLAA